MSGSSSLMWNAEQVNFNFEQRWTADADSVLAAYTSRSFWEGLSDLSATSAPTIVELSVDDSTAVIRLHYRLVVDLPSEAARFIDTSNVAWLQVTTWDLTHRTSLVEFIPDQATRLLNASASTSLKDLSNPGTANSGGSIRKVNGDVKVRIPLLGSRIEKAIISGVGDHLDEEAAAIQRFIG